MTEQPQLHPALQPTPEDEPKWADVMPADNSRLAQLAAEYGEAKRQAAAADARLKEITDGIKAELQQARPNAAKVRLLNPHGPALGLTYSTRWTLDAKRMKAEDPLTYVTYAKKSGSWSLRPIATGDA